MINTLPMAITTITGYHIVACTAVAVQGSRKRRTNSGVMQHVSGQPIGKHVLAAMNTQATIELLLEKVFSTPVMKRSYKENNWGDPVS
jgi:hypothetical protein